MTLFGQFLQPRLTFDTPTVGDSSEGESSEPIKKKSPATKTEKTRIVDIPESIRFDPKSMENKPKGLVDSLTKYFTPGKCPCIEIGWAKV